jgi:hypothetical protein
MRGRPPRTTEHHIGVAFQGLSDIDVGRLAKVIDTYERSQDDPAISAPPQALAEAAAVLDHISQA